MRILIPSLLLTIVLVAPAQAQDAMSTDRPDFTESPLTVGQGTIQIEAGATMETEGDLHMLTSGEGLVRYGLRPALELRLGLPSLISGDEIERGLNDVSVGFKWTLARLDNGVDLGLVAGASLPTGDEGYGSDEVNPSVLFVAGMPLSDRLSVASQVATNLAKGGDEWNADWLATIVLAAGLTDRIGGFVELMTEAPSVGDNALTFHTGFTYGFSDDVQFDLHGGTGLNDAGGDAFFGAGLAIRR